MSSISLPTGVGPGALYSGVLRAQSHAVRFLNLLVPNQGWVSFLLVFMLMVCVATSVESAEWVKLPTTSFVLFTGMLTGVLMSRIRVPAVFLHIPGLVLGVAALAWFLSSLTEAGTSIQGLRILWERLGLWYQALQTGGISIDALPFAAVLTSLVWLLGYISVWSVFRYRNIWVPLVLGGIGILTNLSYLPGYSVSFFVLFLFFSFLAVAWMSFQRRRLVWESQHIQHSTLLGAAGVGDALWFGTLVVIAAMLLPAGVHKAGILSRPYERMLGNLQDLQADFNRLFAGLPARKPTAYRLFDSSLPFQGTLNLSNAPVFTVKTTLPAYFKVRSYPTYTSKGWISGNTSSVPLQALPQSVDAAPYKERATVEQQVDLLISPRLLAASGVPLSSDVPVQAEVALPPVHYIPLSLVFSDPQLQVIVKSQWDAMVAELMKERGITEAEARQALVDEHKTITFSSPPVSPGSSFAVESLSEDLQALRSQLLSLQLVNGKELTERDVRSSLPDGLHLDSVLTNYQGIVTGIYVRWQSSSTPDVLSIQSDKRLYSSDRYAVTSSVSTATPEELRRAGEDYPGWVKDMYLQLPPTLPQRVKDLAVSLTANAETPYDKAIAIQDYLRTLKYNLNIPPPAYNEDGVDHFLFDTREGYSDYFASAMAVMLRAVGVPSRMDVGYSLGNIAKDGTVTVLDRNSHGWTEAFFPGYGWVEFEPTPGNALPGAPSDSQAPDEELQLPVGEFVDPFEEDFFIGTPGGPATAPQGNPWIGRLLWSGAGAGGTAVVLLGFFMLFRWLLGTPGDGLQAYGKLVRLSTLARIGPQNGETPREYGQFLMRLLPELSVEVETVTEAYARSRYGRYVFSPEEKAQLLSAWRSIRLPLLLRALQRRGRRSTMPLTWR